MLNNIQTISLSSSLLEDEQFAGINPVETPGKPNVQPEIEPEKLPQEDPGIQPDTNPGKDDDDDDDDDENNPFKEIEIGDDPEEERKKIPIMQQV